MQVDTRKILALRGLEKFMNAMGIWISDKMNLQAAYMGMGLSAWQRVPIGAMGRRADGIFLEFPCVSRLASKLDFVSEAIPKAHLSPMHSAAFRIAATSAPGQSWRIDLDWGGMQVRSKAYPVDNFMTLEGMADPVAAARKSVEAYMAAAKKSPAVIRQQFPAIVWGDPTGIAF